MKIQATKLSGVYLLTFEPIEDERGFFARCFCKKKLAKAGLQIDFVQCNISYNKLKGTVRGLHYQLPPHDEVKIVFCKRGAIFDVVVDVRKNSLTYGQWLNFELTEHNLSALYISSGFAHGFQSLCDDTEVFYFMGNYYHNAAATGVHWKDPHLNIPWPCSEITISKRDQAFSGLVL